jgi:hypothetical protein
LDGNEENPMKNPQPRFDPDPFSIIVGTAGIIGGVASVVQLYRDHPRRTPGQLHSQITGTLSELKDLLRYAELDLKVLQEVIQDAEIPGDRTFRPGRRVFLTKSQFERYDRAADQLLARLRKVLKATHRLDRLVPDIPALESANLGKQLAESQARLDRLIRDREQTIDQALSNLIAVIDQINRMITETLEQLEGPKHGSG